MRVSRLEIFGFKSFMERLVLPLDAGGMTGVVGPNGCGKSNVVDAIRWVLGETKASALRGVTLEDVIFNGTENLRPLGLAEVTLTVKATGDNLLDEIQKGIKVSLTPNEVTEIEEAIDEEFIDNQSGDSDGPRLRVIDGGRADEELIPEDSITNEPTETESLPEEDETSDHILTRYEWLRSVPELQITRRLYRSGESEFFINRVACRLRDIKELARILGIGARAYTIIAQGEVSRIVSAKPEERRLIIEEAAGVTGLRDKIAEATRRLQDTAANVTRLKDVEREVERQTASLKRQADKARNREMLKKELRRLDTGIFSLRASSLAEKEAHLVEAFQRATSAVSQAEVHVTSFQTREQAVRGDLLRVDVEGDGLRGQIDAIKEELLGRERKRNQQHMRLREVGVARLEREKEIAEDTARIETLTKRKDELTKALSGASEQEHELSKELQSLKDQGREELDVAERALRMARDGLREKENLLRVEREALIKIEASLQANDQHLNAASPRSQLTKALADATLRELFPSSVQMLAQHLKPRAEFVRALEAVLGDKSSYLVATDPHRLGEEFSELFTSLPPEKRKGLGIGVLNAKPTETALIGRAVVPDTITPLLSVTQVSDEAKGIAERLLSHVFVVPSVAEAKKFFVEFPESSLIMVTTAGEVCHADGFARFDRAGGLLELRAKAEAQKEERHSIALRLESATTSRDEAQRIVLEKESLHREALSIIEKRHERMRELSNELGALRGRLQAEKRIDDQLTGDLVRAEQKRIHAQNRLIEYSAELTRLQEEVAALTADDEEPLKAKVIGLAEKLKRFEVTRTEFRKELETISNSLNESRRGLDIARNEKSEAELEISKLRLEFDNLRQRMIQEYGEESLHEEPEGKLSVEALEEAQSEASRIRSRIIREGEVDPDSIQRFEEEQARFAEIQQQIIDLESASRSLSATIGRLTETAERRFTRMFAAVRKNFQVLIPRLFGGGKGSLELSEVDRPLQGGIDIVVRPPGKKPKSIELLSGGEKALTATALIFSIFLERPSPLCILDEVDAPLDEANLLRFLQLIRELSARTQFLMITHNKASMTQADVLVGVTMQEPGASKTISVSLTEALSQVA